MGELNNPVSRDDWDENLRLRAIFQSSVDFAIVATDLDGSITDWNPGAEHILGWSADEMRGQPADRFFTPEDNAQGRVRTEMENSLLSGRASDERWHMRKDGNRFWASGEMMPLRAEDRTHIGYLKILRDATARREAAEAQRVEAEFLRSVLSASSDCIKVLDVDGKLVYISEGGHSALELDDFAVIRGTYWPELWPEPARAAVASAIDAARYGQPHRFQAMAPTFKGNDKFWDVLVTPMRSHDGSVTRLLAVSRDVSELRAAEANLVKMQERLDLALNASDMVGVWDWDVKKNVVYADRRFCEAYGVDGERGIAGLPIEVFIAGIHLDDRARVTTAIDAALAGGGDYFCEYRLVGRDAQPRWVSARGTVFCDDAGVPVRLTGAAVDIAVRKQAEELVAESNAKLSSRVIQELALREKAEEALRQSQKMEAVGQLTGGLAHDFNNLLASISGSIELLRKRAAQGRYGDQDRYLEVAAGATERAAALTHRLLAFSRRQTLDPKVTDANRLIKEMADLINRTIGPEINLSVELDEELWSALVDPHQLENAVLNLCINSRDAMPDGGTLTIRTTNQVVNDANADEWAISMGDYVCVEVVDSGVGIPSENVRRVFEPFFTTKPMGMGTGLGLSMVYGFAKQSGGDVRIQSFVGMGTSVCICLPRHDAEEAVSATPAPLEIPPAKVGETVLLVDDEPMVRMLLAEVLEEKGYAILEAGEGTSAMAILRSDARIDLLVTDVGLPGGMNGRQVADAARLDRPQLPVLFVTGYSDNAMANALPERMHVLLKPFGMDAFAARVKKLIDAD